MSPSLSLILGGVTIALIIHVYLGYPLILRAWRVFQPAAGRPQRPTAWPSISITLRLLQVPSAEFLLSSLALTIPERHRDGE